MNVTSRFATLPFHSAILVLMVLFWVLLTIVLPVVKGVITGIFPCLKRCDIGSTEGGHSSLSVVMSDGSMSGLQDYNINSNWLYSDAFALECEDIYHEHRRR